MNILSIGGSDPSSGAGIQSDIRVFSELGAHTLTAITVITSQNTSKFGIVEPVSPRMLKKQLESLFSDFKIDGIKIGMVYNSKIIKVIHQQLNKLKIPIVVDPVIKSTTMGSLIEKNAKKDFQKYIIPLATIITPNKSEAEFLTRMKISTRNTPEKVAKAIQDMGAKNVAITGFDEKKNRVSDFVLEKNTKYTISGDRIPKINHGSGCNHSAAIVFSLAKKKTIRESLYFAKKFTHNSIKNAKKIGKGIVITDIRRKKGIEEELESAITKFTNMKGIYKNIPECQTNFVFSKQKPKYTKDVLGISGRIVKAGKNVLVAGDLRYGGSKHIATALLSMNKKYPEICSAVNLKYQSTTLSKIKKSKLVLSSYDRSKEPKNVKIQGSTIRWGISSAIKNAKKIPDVIYHKGGFGKEPMIIVFGKTPKNVLEKISKIKG